ncbi:hypothetical protein ACFX14_013226 [Malus domestica]
MGRLDSKRSLPKRTLSRPLTVQRIDHEGRSNPGREVSHLGRGSVSKQSTRAASKRFDSGLKERGRKKYNNTSRYEAKRRDRSPTKVGPTPKSYSKFLIPIHQIFCDVKSETWFKLLKQSKGYTSKLDHTKYYVFHRSLGHTTDDCYTWKNYLEKLVKEGKVDRYLDKPAVQPRTNADTNEESSAKTIWINGIFAKSEHLEATNNSKKRKIQQELLVSQVQAVVQPGPSLVSLKKMP